jgi:hypothetical protein
MQQVGFEVQKYEAEYFGFFWIFLIFRFFFELKKLELKKLELKKIWIFKPCCSHAVL